MVAASEEAKEGAPCANIPVIILVGLFRRLPPSTLEALPIVVLPTSIVKASTPTSDQSTS